MRALLRAKTVVISLSAMAMILACTAETAKEDSTNTFVTVISMQGLSGGAGGTADDELNSDVCIGSLNAFPTSSCSIQEDQATVTMRASPKNQIQQTATTVFNDLVFTRYRVTYVRADGRNVAGVDVPYPFDGAMQLFLPADGSDNSASFVIVRIQAKEEPPLSNLKGQGGQAAISALAQVDFYGADNAGRSIMATGYLNIHFADWVDE
jgi:hypothetical protein